MTQYWKGPVNSWVGGPSHEDEDGHAVEALTERNSSVHRGRENSSSEWGEHDEIVAYAVAQSENLGSD